MNDECPNPECAYVNNDYSATQCDRCGFFLGFPNVRRAASERTALDARYLAARKALIDQGLQTHLDELERLAGGSCPVVSMPIRVCRDLLTGKKYENYFIRVERADREIASEENHATRAMVSERIYPNYCKRLHYGVLSPNGGGLPSYGAVAVRWGSDNIYVEKRASLLESNEYKIFDEFKLGRALGGDRPELPEGYRAVWNDRVKLVVSKLGPEINGALALADIEGFILRAGSGRDEDEYIEVVLYGERGINGDDVVALRLEGSPTSGDEQNAWEEVVERCGIRGLTIG